MIGELDIYGVFVPALLVWAAAATLLTLALRSVLRRIGFYRLVWHGALFDAALFVIVLGAVVTVTKP